MTYWQNWQKTNNIEFQLFFWRKFEVECSSKCIDAELVSSVRPLVVSWICWSAAGYGGEQCSSSWVAWWHHSQPLVVIYSDIWCLNLKNKITLITDYNFNGGPPDLWPIYFEGADGFFLHMSTLELSWIRVFVGLIAYCCYHQFLANICEKSFSIQVCSCKPLATGHRGQWAKLSGQTAKGALFSARFACFALLLTAGFSADARPCARCNWLPGKSLLESPELEDHTSFCPLSHLQAFWRLFFEHFATLSQIFWRFKCKFHFFGARGTRFFRFFRCGVGILWQQKPLGSQVWPRAWKMLDEATSQGA